MSALTPIPVPPGRRLLRALRHWGTPAALLAGCVVTLSLWQSHEPVGGVPGEVLAYTWDLSSPADGRLVQLPTEEGELFAPVREGQLLARLDDSVVQAELGVLRAQINVTRAEITAAATTVRFDRDADRRGQAITEQRLAVDIQAIRIDIIDRRATIEALRMELEVAREQEDRLRDLVERNAESRNALRTAELARQQVATRLAEEEQALTEARRELRQTERRVVELPPAPHDDLDALIAPLQARIALHEAELDVLSRQRDQLEIRSPVIGRISAIYRRPGEVVRVGDPIVRVASEEREYIVAWLPESYPRRPAPGDSARVRPLPIHSASWLAQVESIGPRVELIPEQQRRNPTVPEWGIPVRLTLPPDLPARAGERLDIRF